MSPVQKINFYRVRDLSIVPKIEWYRIGGHRFEFFALPEEIQRWLCEELPAEYAPYSIIIVGKLRGYRTDQLCELVRQGHSQFYLRSKTLTPNIDEVRKPFVDAYPNRNDVQLGFSGLILLQVLKAWPSSLCLVDKVCHVPTNKVQHRRDYSPLFNVLKRKVRKQLVHYADFQGQTWNRPTVTEGVAIAVRAGKRKTQFKGLRLTRRGPSGK